MFLGSPAWIGLLRARHAGGRAARTPAEFIRADAGMALFGAHPDHVVCAEDRDRDRRGVAPRVRRAFGGAVRFIASIVTETIFFLMLSPIMWFGHTMFLAAFCSGRNDRLGRAGARRSLGAVGRWRRASCGRIRCSAGADLLARAHGAGRHPVCAVHRGGPALVDPARRRQLPGLRVGRALMRAGLGGLPEENAPPARIRCAELALAAQSRRRRLRAHLTMIRSRVRHAANAAFSARCESIMAGAHDRTAMDRLYAGFVQRGDLVFDVGSHVGDRIAGIPPARRARGRLSSRSPRWCRPCG